LPEALASAQVVVDLANSRPSKMWRDEVLPDSGRNLLAAETGAGVRHHVALSIVGTDRSDNGYFAPRLPREADRDFRYSIYHHPLDPVPGIPRAIAASSADGNIVRISPGLFQPIAADDVAAIVADVALTAPRNGRSRSPARNRAVQRNGRSLSEGAGDPREVVRDPEARYFGGRSRSARWCRWAKRASAASASTNVPSLTAAA